MTASGRQLNVQRPKKSQIHIKDIALALSRIPRFAGQTPHGIINVAYHSLVVERILEAFNMPPEIRLKSI